MNYMWKFMSNFKEFYNEINSATLTGAIDVIVIRQDDGTYLSSPFHVRFGKIGVLRSREKVVDIEINGEPVDIHMKLGESGEAFFVEETDDPSDVPSYLATSPIPLYLDIGEELEKEKERATKPPDLRPLGDGRRESDVEEPVIIQSCAHSSSVSSGFNVDVVLPYDDDKTSVDRLEPVVVTLETKEEDNEGGSEVVAATVMVNPVIVENSNIGNALLEETGFRPIKDEETDETETSTVVDDVDNLELTNVTEEEKGKQKRKRKRKTTLRRKQQQQLQNKTDNNLTVPNSRQETGSVTKIDRNEEIFQIDIENDESVVEMSAVEAIDVVDCSDWQSKLDFHRYSDGDVSSLLSPCGSRPSTPKSDTEYEMRRMECTSDNDEHRWSWTWGELPVPPKITNDKQWEEPASDDDSSEKAKQIKKDQEEQRSMLGGVLQFMRMSNKSGRNTDKEGMYLDDLMANDLDPEIANLYLSRNTSSSHQPSGGNNVKDEDTESGNGSSLPHSPHSVEGGIGGVASLDSDSDERTSDSKDIVFSLCGNLNQLSNGVPHEKFDQSVVTYDDLCTNPNVFTNPDLVIRIDGKYYNWQTAAPMLISISLFRRPLPDNVVSNLVKDHMPKKQKKSESKGYSWFSWRKSSVTDGPRQKSEEFPDWNQDELCNKSQGNNIPPPPPLPTNNEYSSSCNEDGSLGVLTRSSEVVSDCDGNVVLEHLEKYRKSLRLSSEQIAQLKLKEGSNEALFSVTTAYQGTTRCKCNIYLWKYDDQIIISDIDGTITKSDVLGHILPIVGKSWAQSGVAQLFTNIKKNGYQFCYLSARAIGQARITREYLKSIRQGDVSLPDGPLLLSPSSLISALHREVIEKKPEEFKISCLRDIQALFPQRNPFYAGYGNKINDVWAYRAVGIPMSRIFTINHRGELRHELNNTFQSSYSGLSYVVDHMFPPLRRTRFSNGYLTSDFVEPEEYSSFTYWRDPLPEIDVSLNGGDRGANMDNTDEKK